MRQTRPGEKCDRCGWKHGPHICVDLSKRVPGEARPTRDFLKSIRRTALKTVGATNNIYWPR